MGDLHIPLPQGTDDLVRSCDGDLLGDIVERIKAGTAGVKPDVKMILRHCSGSLFQEANYVAHFDPQLELFPLDEIRYDANPRLIGSYFTPSYIARTIVEETLRCIDLEHKDEITIFDPACGSGVFLVEALRQLRTQGYEGKVMTIGWDISPIAADMASYMLEFEKLEWGQSMSYEIRTCDSLQNHEEWPRTDVIFMNPPYKAWTYMTAEQREVIAEIMEPRIRPNLAAVFYVLASQKVGDDGAVGALMPTSFLTADSHRTIRKETIEQLKPVLISHLGSFVFSSAMADVSVIVASRAGRDGMVQMMWTKNVDEVPPVAMRNLRILNHSREQTSSGDQYSIYKERFDYISNNDMWMPLPLEALQQKKALEHGVTTGRFRKASDLFDIRMGARTGANNIFIISKETYRTLPQKERKYFRPSVDSASLRDGVLKESNYLFYPYPEERLGFENENELQERIPTIYRTVFGESIDLLRRRPMSGGKWWTLVRPGSWQYEERQKLVSTEFGKAGNFGFDERGNYVVERGMAWIPREAMTTEEYFCYVAILNSPYFNNILVLYAKELAGGDLYNLEGKYVRNLPLPNMELLDDAVVDRLRELGKQICRNGVDSVRGALAIVRRLYGER